MKPEQLKEDVERMAKRDAMFDELVVLVSEYRMSLKRQGVSDSAAADIDRLLRSAFEVQK